jgi:ribosome-associated protein
VAKVVENKKAVKEKTAADKEKTTQLQELVIHGMREKKAQDITIIDLKGIKNAVADYFIICSGNSDTQVDAITDSIENEVYKITAQNPWHKEGKQNNEWVLLDYVDVVAHVFVKDKRKFYNLEDLWGDAKITSLDNE